MDIEKYVRPVYGYCLRRLNNVFDAQDLAQEILFEIFRSLPDTDVRNPEAWVWRIAHNRYARFLNGRRRDLVSMNDLQIEAVDDISDDGAADAAFRALHAIAAEHRGILVEHYVHGLSCEEIARRRGMKCATVRTRLHYGRDKLRKRWSADMESGRIYDKLDWHIFGNGDVNVGYMSRQISRAILTACRSGYRTVEEISEATGIPCMYIEDEITELMKGELVMRKGGRYISGVIIYPGEYLKKVNRILEAAAPEIADELTDVIRKNAGSIRAAGFRGCDVSTEKMGWWLVPMLMRAACDRARALTGFERGDFYPRLDGGKGWLVAYEKAENVRRYYAGCNNYYLENSRFRYFWTDKYLDQQLVSLLRRLENHSDLSDDPALAAECIRCGIAGAKDGKAILGIPAFSAAQYEQITALAADCAGPVAQMLVPVADRLRDLMKQYAPVHLHSQIRGLFGIDFNAVIAVVCDIMEQKSTLEKPEPEMFAGQVIMVG